jgi:hypothetical protein
MMRKIMMSKITLVLAAAAVFGAVSVAQANEHEDQWGGFKIGPLGQRMGTTPHMSRWRVHGIPNFGFAFVPRHARVWHHERDYR